MKNVMIVGRTGLVRNCLEVLIRHIEKKHIHLLDLTTEKINYLADYSEQGYGYSRIKSKGEMVSFLRQVQEDVLVLSIMNPYLFPEDITAKENLTIVNLHHSLLPKHPGRNVEAWTIYERDQKAGITWHLVDAGVDSGNILIQKEFPLTEDFTSSKLYRELNRAAIEGLEEIVADMLLGKLKGVEQQDKGRYPLHRSNERPNGGLLDFTWDADHMSAFLRSMDYGVMKTLGDILLDYEGQRYRCKQYRIIRDGFEGNFIRMELPYLYCHRDDRMFQMKVALWQE